ncbi:hypothetical protein Ahy_B06g081116 [Arachis hypogaea]|uniref:PABS domain-containing protein n=1 Tax=Arachis hypogaea TaxID=3818 RepID=A0A444YK93_ARAHY|nr:hypothetical protein Ahy_B06g081116 [Arachis hypogaea]
MNRFGTRKQNREIEKQNRKHNRSRRKRDAAKRQKGGATLQEAERRRGAVGEEECRPALREKERDGKGVGAKRRVRTGLSRHQKRTPAMAPFRRRRLLPLLLFFSLFVLHPPSVLFFVFLLSLLFVVVERKIRNEDLKDGIKIKDVATYTAHIPSYADIWGWVMASDFPLELNAEEIYLRMRQRIKGENRYLNGKTFSSASTLSKVVRNSLDNETHLYTEEATKFIHGHGKHA